MEKLNLKMEKLNLRNFRGFEEIEISFEEYLTVFIGENGSGKTTILDALAGMLTYVVEQIKQQMSREHEPFNKDDIRWKQLYFENELSFKNTLEPLSIKFETRNPVSAFELNNESDVFSELNQKARLGEINLPIIAYYPCYLASYQLSNQSISDADIMYKDAFDAYEHALDKYILDFNVLKKWLIWRFHIEREDNDKTFGIVRESLVGINGILNDEHQTNFIDLKVSYQNSPSGNFIFVKDGVNISEQQLSSGEKMLFALVADIARRLVTANPNSENPLQEGSGVVLIDEIDLHLHPKWQRKVVGKLRELFPNVQFVVTTHSPLVLSNIYSKHIRTIENGNVYGVSDTFGHEDADDMLKIMGFEPELRKKIKTMHKLLALNKVEEAKSIRDGIITEGVFAPLLEIDLFIQRKMKKTV